MKKRRQILALATAGLLGAAILPAQPLGNAVYAAEELEADGEAMEGAVDESEDSLEADALLNGIGKCGENVRWEYDQGVLTIGGEGEMYSYGPGGRPEWEQEGLADKISEIVVENGVTTIGDFAFYELEGDGDVSVSLPAGITVGLQAFRAAKLGDVTIGDGAKIIESAFLEASMGALSFEGEASIGEFAFSDDKISGNAIFEGAVQIEEGGFSGAKISGDVDFRNGGEVGKSAFHEATLENLTIREDTTLRDGAFYQSGMKTATFYGRVTATEEAAFGGCESLTTLRVMNVSQFGEHAFAWCSSLSDVSFREGVADGTTFDSYAFGGCVKLADFTTPRNAFVGYMAFDECSSLKSITLADGATLEGEACCDSTSLKTVKTGNYATINSLGFARCENLESVTLGAGTVVKERAFDECAGLKSIGTNDGVTLYDGTFFNSDVSTLTVDGTLKFDNLSGRNYFASPPKDVYYSGSVAEWQAMVKGLNEAVFKGSTIHYGKGDATPVSGVSLSKTASVAVGKTITLKAAVSPSNATNKNVTWKSGNTKVATVTQKGVVRGVKAGKVTITATAADGSNKKATCSVTVSASKAKTVAVKGVKLNKKTASIKKGKKVTLKATINPANATNKGVTWTSGNKKVATVSAKGVVKGVKKGKATITVTTKDGKKKATCKVTVK